MAVRAVALILASGAAGASAAAICPDATNPMISVVTDVSPACFQGCPALCGPLDDIVNEYMATSSTDAVKSKICGSLKPFSCMYETSNFDACATVLMAGSALGTKLPMSEAELEEMCGLSEAEPSRGDGAHLDIQPEDKVTDPNAGGDQDMVSGTTGHGSDLARAAMPIALSMALLGVVA